MRRISIRARLWLGAWVYMLLLAATAGVGAWRLAELGAVVHELTTVNVRMEGLVNSWLGETRSNLVRSLVITHTDDPQLQGMLKPELDAATGRIEALTRQIEPLLATQEARDLFQQIVKQRKEASELLRAGRERKKAGEAITEAMQAQTVAAADRYLAALEALRSHYEADAAQDDRNAVASVASGRRFLFAFCGAGLLLALCAAWLITRSIVRPLDEAVASVARVADGDLTVEIHANGGDELTKLQAGIAAMVASLRLLAGQVVTGARAVADASAQIAQGNADLSQRTEEQASTLQETASSMEELTSTVAQNAQTAAQASQLAASARNLATQGGQAVAQVEETMRTIASSSTRISEITGLIDGIAFQTNILALNAAVEAARAGVQGRGFAVVASEVRTLAQSSALAAREIKDLLAESARQVDTGTAEANAAGRGMEEIIQAIVRVSDLFAGIAAASQEQTGGIEQVNTAVLQMDQVVQQNAALVEEAAAATAALSANAAELLALASRFRVDAHVPAKHPPSPSLESAMPSATRFHRLERQR